MSEASETSEAATAGAPAPSAPGFGNYQNDIYLNGLDGQLPPFTTDLTLLGASAREHLDPGAFGYLAGAAGSGATHRANREAFDRHRLVPRMLRGPGGRDLSTTVLGTRMPAPVLLAPVGVQSIIHPDGELATARAAATLGVPMVLSTASSHTIEEVAEANGPDGAALVPAVLAQRRRGLRQHPGARPPAGFTDLVVTLDTWTLAWRPQDLDQSLPALHPRHRHGHPLLRPGLPRGAGEVAGGRRDLGGAALGADVHRHRPLLGPAALPARALGRAIVLKGVLHPDDARKAADAGMDGVVVSNHGGRQVDGAIASLDALPGIAEAVGDRLEVLFDSGIRTGSDVLKALALGARAVLVGPPVRVRPGARRRGRACCMCCAACSPTSTSPSACPGTAPRPNCPPTRCRAASSRKPHGAGGPPAGPVRSLSR